MGLTTDSSYTASIEFVNTPEETLCSCDGCSWAGMANELNKIGYAILTPGDASPAGRCPECESLAYVIKFDPMESLRSIRDALRDHPDVNVGNSKVHFAFSKALAAVLQ